MFSKSVTNDYLTVKETSNKILYCAFILYFLYPFFRDILPMDDIFWMLSILAGLFVCVFKFNLRIIIPPVSLFWIALALLALGAFLVLGPDKTVLPKRMSLFLVSMLMMIALSKDREWIRPALLSCLTLLSIHAFATIILNAAPILYERLIAPVIQGSSTTVIGPKAGLTSHYSYNGQLVAIGFLISYVLYKMSPFRDGNKASRARYGFLAVSFAIALLLTTKRAPLLICIMAIIITEYLTSPGRRGTALFKMICVGFIVCIAVAVFGDQIPVLSNVMDRLSVFFTSSNLEESTTGRIALWNKAIQLWSASPVFGSGWGTYRYYWIDGYHGVSTAAHNVFLQLLAEVGMVGLIVFLVPALLVLFGLAKSVRMLEKKRQAFTAEGSLYEFVDASIFFAFLFQMYFFIYCFVGAPLYDFESFPVYFVLSCGVWYATCRPKRQNDKMGHSVQMSMG